MNERVVGVQKVLSEGKDQLQLDELVRKCFMKRWHFNEPFEKVEAFEVI